MNNINFYATVDQSQLQIADGSSYYGGNIDSYNNPFTRFIAKVFMLRIDVNFNGKIHSLNKTSYRVFLHSNGIQATRQNLSNYIDFNTVMNSRTSDWSRNGRLRDKITRSKSIRLYKKLVYALNQGDLAKAQKFAGKGANIERDFWERDSGYGISFHEINADIPRTTLEFRATRYNPILYSASKEHHAFAEFLVRLGSSTTFQGETSLFRRSISHVGQEAHLHNRFVPVYHPPHMHFHHGHYGHLRPFGHVHHYPGRVDYVAVPEVHTETVYHYQDTKTRLHTHRLGENLEYVTENAS